jgi:AraC-like DNA-binding protein
MEGEMLISATPLLERHRVFHSADVEETRAFLGGKGYQLDVPPRQASQLHTRINAVYMPSLYIGHMQYGSLAVGLAPGPARTDVLVQLPIRGHLTATVGRECIEGSSSRAVITSPVQEKCHFVSSPGSSRLQLALSQLSLTGQLAALVGEPVHAPLHFAPAMDLTNGYGRSLAQHVLMAVASLDETDSVLLNPITMTAFEQFIMTALLLSHPHSHSEALRRLERPIAPRDVRRAIDYIEANIEQPITVADLVNVTGVAGRTLFMHFKIFKGVSPMRYLRNARLQQVRHALLQADPQASVTGIAMMLGFTHMGRFSVEYRRRFGESPSQTLKQRHQRCRPIRNGG